MSGATCKSDFRNALAGGFDYRLQLTARAIDSLVHLQVAACEKRLIEGN